MPRAEDTRKAVGRWKTTHHDDVGTTLLGGTQGTTFGEPVAVRIIGNPVDDSGLFLLGDALIRVADTLENVVDVLGDTEDTRTRLRDWKQV